LEDYQEVKFLLGLAMITRFIQFNRLPLIENFIRQIWTWDSCGHRLLKDGYEKLLLS